MERHAGSRSPGKNLPKALFAALLLTLLSVAVLFPTSADAEPRIVTSVNGLGSMALDGANLYWTDGAAVTRVDINTGLGSRVFRAPRGFTVTALRSNAGRVAILSNKRVNRATISKVSAFTLASGQNQTLATRTMRNPKGAACGSDLTLGNITDGGEIIVLASTLSLSKKKCRKPLRFDSTVLGFAPGGTRQLFNQGISGEVIGKLGGPVVFADLRGDKLALSSSGAGVVDLTTGQFVLVKPASRSILSAEFDPSSNLLINGYNPRDRTTTGALIAADGGYISTTRLDPVGNANRFFRACGNRIAQVQYNAKSNQSAYVLVFANPLKPDGSGPFHLLPATKTPLWGDACDATNFAYALNDSTTGLTQHIFIAPVAGP